MRLADFILANVEEILAEWERFARSLAPGTAMSVIALRDQAEDILRGTAHDMLSSQSAEQQSAKSKGHGGGGTESERLDSASNAHAVDRLGSGFHLIEVVSEYRALRGSVLRLWREAVHDADEHDLQDLTRFNEAIDQSLAEAVRSYTQRVDESRELFLATLGHDLRTPLNAIMVSAELVARSGQLDDENAQIASQMVDFGKAMAGMIRDLLDFTRTRLGAGIPVSVAPLDLKNLCHEVLGEFRAAHPDRAVRFQSAGDTSGEWDAARLRQVLSNLIANAIEHGDETGPIEVSARSEGSDVLLAVTNQGPPISPSALPTLFDPFIRVASPRRLKEDGGLGGIGLGLYIAREIVTAHGGTIAVASSEATGTVFSVRLPRRQETEQTRKRDE
jgi:signal transduction histidine kinase